MRQVRSLRSLGSPKLRFGEPVSSTLESMKILAPVALCLLYVAAFVGLGSAFGSVASLWLTALLSLLFLFAYRRFVRGSLMVPFAVVFFVTLVLPIAVLFAIGMPVYHSWSSTANSLFASLRDHGQFWGLELFAPLLTTAAGVLVLRWRSNIAIKRDAPQAARPLL